MPATLVSIGIPVYNVEKFIARCAKSIFEQTYKDLEIVFVSDCSPDRSIEIIKDTLLNYPDRQNQVKIIQHEKNEGVSVTRNTAIEHFTGEFVSFVDADDYLLPNAIELLVAKQRENNADIVSGVVRRTDGESEQDFSVQDSSTADKMLLNLINMRINPSVYSRVYRSSIIKDNNIRFVSGLRIGEDWHFLTNYVRYAQSVSAIKDIVYIYNYSNPSSALHTESDETIYNQWCFKAVPLLLDIKKQKNTKSFDVAIDDSIAKRIDKGFRMNSKNHNKRAFKDLVQFNNSLDYKPVNKVLFRYLRFGNKPNYYLYVIYNICVSFLRRIL